MAQQNQQNQTGRNNTTSTPSSTPSREGMNKTSERGFGSPKGTDSDIQADGIPDGHDISGRPVEVNAGRNAAPSKPDTSASPSTHSLSDEDVDADEADMDYKGSPSRQGSNPRDESSRI